MGPHIFKNWHVLCITNKIKDHVWSSSLYSRCFFWWLTLLVFQVPTFLKCREHDINLNFRNCQKIAVTIVQKPRSRDTCVPNASTTFLYLKPKSPPPNSFKDVLRKTRFTVHMQNMWIHSHSRSLKSKNKLESPY